VKTLLVAPVKFRRLAILVLAMLIMLTTASVAAGSGEKFIQEPDRESGDEVVMTPFATLEAGGATLRFHELLMPDGSVAGIGVAQTVRAGHSGIESVRELRGADALEVYNALSSPGMRLPKQLVKEYGKPELGRQGWALPLDLPLTDGGNPQQLSCMVGAEPFGAFEDDIISYGYPSVFLSEKDGPGTQPGHWFDDNSTGDGSIRRQLQGGVTSKEHFYGKVSYCYEDLYNQTGFQGRWVSFHVKINGAFGWNVMDSAQMMDPGDSLSYHFSPSNTHGFEFDFRMNIIQAKTSDMFHIGATWANPSETITLGE